MPTTARLAGVDLAWKPERNGTAIAVGLLDGASVHVEQIHCAVLGLSRIAQTILSAEPAGVAVDAPLIIENESGRRPCERALSRVYASKYAGCHTSNQTLYPDAAAVALSRQLSRDGYRHLGRPSTERYQIEIYPHPALIEMFNLPQRLMYKKGSVNDKRNGQIVLASLLRKLEGSPILSLQIPERFDEYLDPRAIAALRGDALKANEDAMDALICLYICGLYALGTPMRVFGDVVDGYVVVPMSLVV